MPGGFDPLKVVDGTPAAYTEKLQFNPQKIEPLPKTYILCTESEFIPVTSLAREKIAESRKKWNYIELQTSHIPMATMPDKFAQLLLKPGEGL